MIPVIKAKYKVTRVFMAQEGYAALYAVRITERSKSEYLLNVYAGEVRYRYDEVFLGMDGCGAFVEMFIWEGALISVFRVEEGARFDDVFYKGAEVGWRDRLEYAGRLVDAALPLALLPHEMACAAIMSFNLVVRQAERNVAVNYAAPPLDGASGRELLLLLGDQLYKILLPHARSAAAELRFLERLGAGEFESMAKLYSAWLSARGEIEAEYEDFYSRSAVGRAAAVAKRRVKNLFSRKGRKPI
ncbi:MAG: hypothetical protein LBJ99_01180 [Oscillospiraceae bacterium]|jgi:hypothetical protein|nr:hypothetical protein [Oscillospiraceae bacterium]